MFLTIFFKFTRKYQQQITSKRRKIKRYEKIRIVNKKKLDPPNCQARLMKHPLYLTVQSRTKNSTLFPVYLGLIQYFFKELFALMKLVVFIKVLNHL